LTQKTVISIVDDDESVREALGSLIKSYGYETRVYESAAAFLQSGTQPDCLVADIHMPGMSGIELCKQLTARGVVPVILITARHDEALRSRAFGAGASCYIVKPIDEPKLLKCIHSATTDAGFSQN
jgi:FixJ family two-component response regulator